MSKKITNLVHSTINTIQTAVETAKAAKPDCTWVRFLKRSQNTKTGEWFDSFKPLFVTDLFGTEDLADIATVVGMGNTEQDFETTGQFMADVLHVAAKNKGGRDSKLGRSAWVQARRIEGMVASTKMRVPAMQIWQRVNGVTSKIS